MDLRASQIRDASRKLSLEEVTLPALPASSLNLKEAIEVLLSTEGRKRCAKDAAVQTTLVEALADIVAVGAYSLVEEYGMRLDQEKAEKRCRQLLPELICTYQPIQGAPLLNIMTAAAEQLVEDEAQRLLKKKILASGRKTQPEEELYRPEEAFREYAWRPFVYATTDLTLREKLGLKLYFFEGREVSELALIFERSEAQTAKALQGILEKVSAALTSRSLFANGEAEGRASEAESLKLKESFGFTLLRVMIREKPRLRRSAEVLSLCAHSKDFFTDLAHTEDPEVLAFRPALYSPGKALAIQSLPLPIKQIITAWAKKAMPSMDFPHYDTALGATFGGVALQTSQEARAFSSTKCINELIRELIKAGILSSRVRAENPLTVAYRGESGARHVRHPLLRKEVVGLEQCRENISAVLRERLPNLDAVCKEIPVITSIKGLLNLSKKATIEDVRKELLRQEHLSAAMPEGFIPSTGTSVYFDPAYLTSEQIRANQDELIRRRWAHLDDVEEDVIIAGACGVPNRVSELTKRAFPVLGGDIPPLHPLNYLPRESTRYLNPEYVTDPAQLERNFKRVIAEHFQSIDLFTDEEVTKRGVSLKRLATLLGVEINFDSVVRACVEQGLVNSKRPTGAPTHRPNGKLSYYFYSSVVGKAQAEQNFLEYLDERFGRENAIPFEHMLVRAITIASDGELAPVWKGYTFRNAVEILRARYPGVGENSHTAA